MKPRIFIAVTTTLAVYTLSMLNAHAAPPHGDRVFVQNTAADPVPVAGHVSISGTANVSVTNPVTIANPVSTVTVGNVNPIPISGAVSVVSMPAIQVTNFPSHPFFGRIDGDGTAKTTGSAAGLIGVTSILITNNTNQSQYFNFFNSYVSDPTKCVEGSSTQAIGGAYPYMYLSVEAQKTTQYTFPTPLVFSSVNSNGATCIGSGAPSGVMVFISGITE
jgi:hypothetical protein